MAKITIEISDDMGDYGNVEVRIKREIGFDVGKTPAMLTAAHALSYINFLIKGNAGENEQ